MQLNSVKFISLTMLLSFCQNRSRRRRRHHSRCRRRDAVAEKLTMNVVQNNTSPIRDCSLVCMHINMYMCMCMYAPNLSVAASELGQRQHLRFAIVPWNQIKH